MHFNEVLLFFNFLTNGLLIIIGTFVLEQNKDAHNRMENPSIVSGVKTIMK